MPLNDLALSAADEVFKQEIGHAFDQLQTDIANSPANDADNLSKAGGAILQAHLEWRRIQE